MTLNNISVTIPESGWEHWVQITQHGISCNVATEVTVRTLLEEELGFSHDYVENRIETVFLDGMPVDDIDASVAHNGARIALAAALPGAAGIAMRRNSPVAALRGNITHEHETATTPQQGIVTLRLFNLIMQERSRYFLEKGVGVSLKRLAKMLTTQSDDLKKHLSLRYSGNETSITIEEIVAEAEKNPQMEIHLRVVTA